MGARGRWTDRIDEADVRAFRGWAQAGGETPIEIKGQKGKRVAKE
jgi:hypothetical protein